MRRLVVLVLLCGCTSSALPRVPEMTVDLPGLGLRMDVPEGSKVSRSRSPRFEDTKTFPWDGPVKIEFAPGGRYPKTMTLQSTDEWADAGLEQNDGALNYKLAAIDGGQSEERELIGHIELPARRLDVRCTCAGEAGEDPSLGWCRTALRSLRE